MGFATEIPDTLTMLNSAFSSLAALAEFYGVSLDYLFCRSEVPEPLGSFSPEERLLERYREMDPRGRRLLSAMADLECDLESDRH